MSFEKLFSTDLTFGFSKIRPCELGVILSDLVMSLFVCIIQGQVGEIRGLTADFFYSDLVSKSTHRRLEMPIFPIYTRRLEKKKYCIIIVSSSGMKI